MRRAISSLAVALLAASCGFNSGGLGDFDPTDGGVVLTDGPALEASAVDAMTDGLQPDTTVDGLPLDAAMNDGAPDATVDGPPPPDIGVDAPVPDTFVVDAPVPDTAIPDTTVDTTNDGLVFGAWTEILPSINISSDLKSAWSSSAFGPRYIAGKDGVLARYFGSWLFYTPSGLGSTELRGIFGFASGDRWACGKSGLILYHNGNWVVESSPENGSLNAAWGNSPSDMWIVGDDGKILRRPSGSWASVASPTNKSLKDIWGFSASDIWAAGESGRIIHWDGSAWTVSRSGGDDLRGIWGAVPNKIWAVGGSGTTWVWDGSSWNSAPSAGVNLKDVHGTTDGQTVWAVGDGGAIFRWNQTSWTSEPSPTGQGLEAVYVDGLGRSTIVGKSGTVLWRQ